MQVLQLRAERTAARSVRTKQRWNRRTKSTRVQTWLSFRPDYNEELKAGGEHTCGNELMAPIVEQRGEEFRIEWEGQYTVDSNAVPYRIQECSPQRFIVVLLTG